MSSHVPSALDSRSYDQLKVVAITVAATIGAVRLWDLWRNRDSQQSLYGELHKFFLNIVYRIPKFKKIKDQKLNEIKKSFERSVLNDRRNAKTITRLPFKNTRKDEILKILNENLQLGSFDWKNGRVSGAVYRYDETLIEMLSEVYTLTSYTNPLHPDIFPGLNKMEAEVIRMVSCLFHGNDRTCGSITSGGTESILMACKAYRDYARLTKNIRRPEILVPVTAHAAFDKAAQYFGLVIRHVPMDKKSAKVSVHLMEKYINSNTIMLAGSTPNFPYGTMDDIVAIGALGTKYNIPVHVDACLGGFLLVFMNKAGYKLAPFDFQAAGVTSISADSHKYGYCPKGSSIILYSDEKYFKCQFSTVHSWPGGCYASPTTCGSRPGSAISTLWATLLYFGENEFIEATRSIIQTTKYILKCLKAVNGLDVFGEPEVSVIAVRSSKFDIFLLLNFLKNRGWNLNNLQYPSGFHLCVTYMHTKPGIADRFVHDVEDGVADIFANFKNLPKIDDQLSLYGMAQTISDKEIVNDILRTYLTSLYIVNNDGNGDDDDDGDERSL